MVKPPQRKMIMHRKLEQFFICLLKMYVIRGWMWQLILYGMCKWRANRKKKMANVIEVKNITNKVPHIFQNSFKQHFRLHFYFIVFGNPPRRCRKRNFSQSHWDFMSAYIWWLNVVGDWRVKFQWTNKIHLYEVKCLKRCLKVLFRLSSWTVPLPKRKRTVICNFLYADVKMVFMPEIRVNIVTRIDSVSI